MTKLIAINGEIGSGKDLAGKILKVLLHNSIYSDKTIAHMATGKIAEINMFELKKFATPLKEVVSVVTGIPVHMFEEQEFKENFYWNPQTGDVLHHKSIEMGAIINTIDEYNSWTKHMMKDSKVSDYVWIKVRLLLQYEGTEIGRMHRGKNCWVNRLFYDFNTAYSHWVITDLRFMNEFEAVKKRGGQCIRIERDSCSKGTHASDNDLNDVEFDYLVSNNGTIADLVAELRKFAIKFKLIRDEKDPIS